MKKITPFLWFNNNAEEAIDFYTAVFKDVKVKDIVRVGGGPAVKGQVLTASIELFGQEFVMLNGGPQFQFNEAVSFVVNCSNQEEVDYYWERLSDGGSLSRCGWLKDRFGLSWQVVPTILPKMLQDNDPARSQRVMQAMMQMDKIHIPTLEKAFAGE